MQTIGYVLGASLMVIAAVTDAVNRQKVLVKQAGTFGSGPDEVSTA